MPCLWSKSFPSHLNLSNMLSSPHKSWLYPHPHHLIIFDQQPRFVARLHFNRVQVEGAIHQLRLLQSQADAMRYHLNLRHHHHHHHRHHWLIVIRAFFSSPRSWFKDQFIWQLGIGNALPFDQMMVTAHAYTFLSRSFIIIISIIIIITIHDSLWIIIIFLHPALCTRSECRLLMWLDSETSKLAKSFHPLQAPPPSQWI